MDSLACRQDRPPVTGSEPEFKNVEHGIENEKKFFAEINEFHQEFKRLYEEIVQTVQGTAKKLQEENINLKKELLNAKKNLRVKDEALERANMKVKELASKDVAPTHALDDAVLYWEKEMKKMKEECIKEIRENLNEVRNASKKASVGLEPLKKQLSDLADEMIATNEDLRMATRQNQMAAAEGEQMAIQRYEAAYANQDIQFIHREFQINLKRVLDGRKETIDNLREENQILKRGLSETKEQLDAKDLALATADKEALQLKLDVSFLEEVPEFFFQQDMLNIQQNLVMAFDYLVRDAQKAEECFQKGKAELEKELLTVKPNYTFTGTEFGVEPVEEMETIFGADQLITAESKNKIQDPEVLLKLWLENVDKKFLNVKQKTTLMKQHVASEAFLNRVSSLTEVMKKEEEKLQDGATGGSMSSMPREDNDLNIDEDEMSMTQMLADWYDEIDNL